MQPISRTGGVGSAMVARAARSAPGAGSELESGALRPELSTLAMVLGARIVPRRPPVSHTQLPPALQKNCSSAQLPGSGKEMHTQSEGGSGVGSGSSSSTPPRSTSPASGPLLSAPPVSATAATAAETAASATRASAILTAATLPAATLPAAAPSAVRPAATSPISEDARLSSSDSASSQPAQSAMAIPRTARTRAIGSFMLSQLPRAPTPAQTGSAQQRSAWTTSCNTNRCRSRPPAQSAEAPSAASFFGARSRDKVAAARSPRLQAPGRGGGATSCEPLRPCLGHASRLVRLLSLLEGRVSGAVIVAADLAGGCLPDGSRGSDQ